MTGKFRPDDAAGRRHPRAIRPDLSLSILEGRALMSGMAHPLGTLHAEVSAAHTTASGMVHKRPAFYEFYTGPRNRDLNVVSASVQLVGGKKLVLTGTMQGPIVRKPKDAAHESYFVFGIDRHSPKAVTPFFHRPGVTFDAVVVVSVEQEGITASVTDLTNRKTTAIDPKAVHIFGRTVTVTVPASLFPTPEGGVDLAHSSFNLWPRSDLSNAPQPDHGSFVASFIPEDAMAPIGIRRF